MANEEQPPKNMMTTTDSCKIYEDMSGFYRKEVFSDVNLILCDKTIPAHKIVLAIGCKYFESILIENPKQSEIILEDVPSKAFEAVLLYIYTGSVLVEMSYGDDLFDVIQLARKYSLKSLEDTLYEKTVSIMCPSNICLFLNKSNELQMDELKQICLLFIDSNLSKILGTNLLNVLTQKSMVQLLERDCFPAHETEIFEIAASWCGSNTDVNNLVSGCVKLTKLTIDELFNVVWPSKIIESERLLNALVSIRNNSTNTAHLINKNIAVAAYNAKVISGIKTLKLLEGTENEDEGARHDQNDVNGITLDLGLNRSFNHVKLKMLGIFYSSYYLETSFNQRKWYKLIDYSQYACSYEQNLYFDGVHQARYIRAVFSKLIPLGKFEVSFDSTVPEVHNHIIYPSSNVIYSETKIFMW
ncbi:hypothetical protein Zmor_024279 [Zophobas morio]|uniref:BTB domain-containing protein n=1 Tax=Zophobas morio TaxID=2755281 RepID=A0AA38M7X8_9CUCU|nr:hypothetical protein Zmor_024279 [Zophobas morio]